MLLFVVGGMEENSVVSSVLVRDVVDDNCVVSSVVERDVEENSVVAEDVSNVEEDCVVDIVVLAGFSAWFTFITISPRQHSALKMEIFKHFNYINFTIGFPQPFKNMFIFDEFTIYNTAVTTRHYLAIETKERSLVFNPRKHDL